MQGIFYSGSACKASSIMTVHARHLLFWQCMQGIFYYGSTDQLKLLNSLIWDKNFPQNGGFFFTTYEDDVEQSRTR
jgi:hypothetical protein